MKGHSIVLAVAFLAPQILAGQDEDRSIMERRNRTNSAKQHAEGYAKAHPVRESTGLIPLAELAKQLLEHQVKILNNLHAEFLNLKIAYVSSRIYGGWAGGPLNPEP